MTVSLEALVPADNFYRHPEAKLDLSVVRAWVRGLYADRGRPSIDPVVFFKLQLVVFFEGIRSERQLLRVVADRLSLRWYLGYGLGESLPDHSGLTRIRERYGLDVFRSFFGTVVERCVAAGPVWGEELDIDATKVEANAALSSLQPRFAVEAHLARLFAPGADAGDDDRESGGPACAGGRGAPARLPVALSLEARVPPAEEAIAGHDRIGQAGRPDRTAARVRIDGPPTAASAPPTPTPPQCRAARGERAWVTKTIAWSMAAMRGSS